METARHHRPSQLIQDGEQPGATATIFDISQGDVESAPRPRVYSYSSSTGSATITVPPGGHAEANAGVWDPFPFTRNDGKFRAEIGNTGGLGAWVYSDVYAETNCDGGGEVYGARGLAYVNGPGSADGEDSGLLIEIESSQTKEVGANEVKKTYWAVNYHDEIGRRFVEDDFPAQSSYQRSFVARTPQRIGGGSITDDTNEFWFRQPKTYAKSHGACPGFVDANGNAKNSNASGNANGDIAVYASLLPSPLVK